MLAKRITIAAVTIALLSAAIVAAHLVPNNSDTIVEAEFRDTLHFLGFGVVAAVLFELIPARPIRRAVISLATAVAIGLVAEYMQTIGGYEFNVPDVYRDFAGAAVYVVARLLWVLSTRYNEGLRANAIRGLAIATAASLLGPLAFAVVDMRQYYTRFPLVFDAANSPDERLVIPINSTLMRIEAVGSSTAHYHAVLQRPARSGIRVANVVTDWSDYDTLVVRAAIDTAPDTQIEVRLLDGIYPDEVRAQHKIGVQPVGPKASELRFALEDIDLAEGHPPLRKANVEYVLVLGRHGGDEPGLRVEKIWLE